MSPVVYHPASTEKVFLAAIVGVVAENLAFTRRRGRSAQAQAQAQADAASLAAIEALRGDRS